MAVAILIFIDLINSAFTAKERIKHLKSYLTWIDLLSVIPIFVTFTIGGASMYYNKIFQNFWRVWRNLRLFRIYKILFKVRNVNNLQYMASLSNTSNNSELRHRFANKIFHILVFVIISASLMMTFNKMVPELFKIKISYETEFTFDAALYFVVITATTVGYGDMAPETPLARIIICFFFIGSIIFITKQSSELLELFK